MVAWLRGPSVEAAQPHLGFTAYPRVKTMNGNLGKMEESSSITTVSSIGMMSQCKFIFSGYTDLGTANGSRHGIGCSRRPLEYATSVEHLMRCRHG